MLNNYDLDSIFNIAIDGLAIFGILWMVGNAIISLGSPVEPCIDDPDGYDGDDE